MVTDKTPSPAHDDLTLCVALSQTPPPVDELAELRAVVASMDEKQAAEDSDAIRRVFLAAYMKVKVDRPWPKGDVLQVRLGDDGGTWDAVDLIAEGKRLARMIAADVWRRIFGGGDPC